ncbi:MAG TPA: hypothetical protein VK558_07355 [Patescibacteria group bacterium]|nr:hypothetical protein [Patescibacteria group bacterium]
MKNLDITAMSDEQIIHRYAELLVHAGQQRTVEASNALVLEAADLRDALITRGPETLRKLLALLRHEDCHVQVAAAMLCYKISPSECGSLLWKQAESHTPVSTQAMVFLLRTDPAYREFLGEETDKSAGGTWWRDLFNGGKDR